MEIQTKQFTQLDKWTEKLTELKASYKDAAPFPHIVLDNFLEPQSAQKAYESFPSVKDDGWIHYVHFNEKKHGLNKKDLLPPFIKELIAELNAPATLEWLKELTGIKDLLKDEMLEGGGLHQSLKGGFLNIHADFTVHPHKRNWRRRVNLLIYLNRDWKDEYGGQLELWSTDMKECVQRVTPIFNRCVIFNTTSDSFHGLPEPINCPEDDTRKSIALYYFTEEEHFPEKRSTNYRARPGDGFRSVIIYLDKTAVAVYSRMKGALGINDDFISKFLNIFGKKK